MVIKRCGDIKCDEMEKGLVWEAVGARLSCSRCLGDHMPGSVY